MTGLERTVRCAEPRSAPRPGPEFSTGTTALGRRRVRRPDSRRACRVTAYDRPVAILIDPPGPQAHGRQWSHLVSDSDLDELHAFARRCGIPRRAFEGDHYDIPEERYAAVVAAGAAPTPPRELLRALVESGLRMPKRQGDKGIARVRGVRLVDGPVADVDLFASPREVAASRVFAATVFVRDAVGDVAVVYSVRRGAWGPPGGRRESREGVRASAVREVAEETGLVAPPEALVPCGYERFRAVTDDRRWLAGRDLLQVYQAAVPGTRPELGSTFPDTSERRWVTVDEFADLCGGAFWWPLAERVIRPPGD
jgi:ADP-ribose pyrophosphatase YjhB (NUDIX family)